ncbi:MAG: LuxR C-terminal-related transcriptional regulator [Coxiellaceae bacterium]|nr:LuxR C-terminal-related transcriptional regulator [Coxiellaceae bacterium]
MHSSHWQDIIDFFAANGSKKFAKKKSTRKPGKFTVDKYQLEGEFSGQYITPKQCKILLHFLKGRTAEQVAKAEGLSVRTVDDYSKVLRGKFGYQTKQSMVDYLNEQDYQSFLNRLIM